MAIGGAFEVWTPMMQIFLTSVVRLFSWFSVFQLCNFPPSLLSCLFPYCPCTVHVQHSNLQYHYRLAYLQFPLRPLYSSHLLLHYISPLWLFHSSALSVPSRLQYMYMCDTVTYYILYFPLCMLTHFHKLLFMNPFMLCLIIIYLCVFFFKQHLFLLFNGTLVTCTDVDM